MPRPSFTHWLAGTLILIGASVAGAAEPPFVLHGSDPAAAPSSPLADRSFPRDGARSWPAAIGENFGTPTFYDLDGDGVMEVIAVDRQRTYVFNAQGGLLPHWPQSTGEVNNPAAVADIDEDGTPEILVVSSGAPPRIHCLHVDGTSQPGFPVALPYQYWLNASAPAVADVDGDGHLDVGAQSEPGVAFFDRFGHALPGWPYLWTTEQNIVWSAPAVGDLDGDGANEVVVGNNNLYDWAVHAIRSDGTPMAGWPQPTRNIFSSAALADLDGDGDLEIVVQEGDPTWYGGRMHVWHHDGSYLPGWPRSIADDWEGSRSNPAIADVDGNGVPEIVTATGDARLHVLNADGTEFPGYPRLLPGGAISSPAVLDVDADGTEEIFLCYYLGGNQWVGGWDPAGAPLPGFPKLLYAASQLDAHSSVHLADMDGDGDLDLCAQGGTFGSGRVWVYPVDGSVFDPASSRADWPKIRHDLHNTGRCERPDPAGIAGGLAIGAPRLACWPNPIGAGGSLSLRLPGDGPGRVLIFDANGRRVGAIPVVGGAAAARSTRDLTRQATSAGCYFLRWSPVAGPAAFARLTVLPR